MKHVRGAIVCLAALLWSAVLCAGEVEDGLYAWRMDGRGPRMARDDGVEVALVHRVGSTVGEATLTSISNDNSEFVLCLRGIKLTTPKADTSDVALVVAGMCLRVSENSDKDRPEGRIDVTGRPGIIRRFGTILAWASAW